MPAPSPGPNIRIPSPYQDKYNSYPSFRPSLGFEISLALEIERKAIDRYFWNTFHKIGNDVTWQALLLLLDPGIINVS